MANNISVLDSAAAAQVVKTTDTAGVHTPHHNVDSSALPTGAATAAKQPALGTAGSASTDVITIQGIASMTPMLSTLTGTNNIATVTTVTTVSTVTAVTTLGTITNVVHIDDNAGSITVDGTVAISGTVTVGSHAVTNAGTFVVQVDGTALTRLTDIETNTDSLAVVGAGTAAAAQRVTFASDAPPITLATETSKTIGTIQAIATALPAGTNAIGKLSANAGVNIGDVSPVPGTAGGLTIARDIDLDNGTLTVVKASAGQLYGYTITNTTAATVFVKFYDATSGTLGTGTPVMTVAIPGNATDDVMVEKTYGGHGVTFATGICVGAGTAVADADNTDPGANAVVANIFYK